MGVLGVLLLPVAASRAPAQVVINEVLAKNTFTNFDDEGKAEDWAELKNLGATPIELAGYTLSDDPLDPGKWVFPDVTIPAGGYLLVWLSGKDRYVPPPEAIGSDSGGFAFEPRFIDAEATWRYQVADPAVAGPPAGWAEVDFDDRSFSVGNSGFGYGDGDDFTELEVDTTAVFVRRSFSVPDPEALLNLVLEVDYDDGFVAYLNGVRVAAANAPPGDPDFTSRATGKHEAGTPERFDLTARRSLLREGENVLAIVGLNDTPSSDMSLMPRLGVVPLILHTNFRAASGGDFIILSSPEAGLVDQVQLPAQTEDHSYGRSPDGLGSWAYFLTPTPSAPNSAQAFSEPIADTVSASPDPGFYPAGGVAVTFSTGLSSRTDIHYTTDGSEPTTASSRYESAVAVDRNTVFRVAGFIDGERSTRVKSYSYFLAESFTLPVMSISMDPNDYATVHNTAGGRGRSSERAAFLEYFVDGQRDVAVGFGMRLHGGAGRGGDFNTKKSYKAYFRGVYGAKKLEYPIIPETPVEVFDKLVLRAGFNDSYRTNGRSTYLRDELIRDLHEDMGALVSHGSWCNLFVNMRFRGLFNIVERMDEEFLSSYLEGEDWDVIKTGNDVLVGTRDAWDTLRGFVVDNDMSLPAHYRRAQELLDVENFTSYMILNMWAQNHDWPHNNWYAARRRAPGSRWIFLSWDAEFGIGLIPQGYSNDSFTFTLGRNGYLRDIFVGLLDSEDYRSYFMSELDRHLAGALAPSNVLAHLGGLRDTVIPDIDQEVSQFGRNRSHWLGNVAAMATFAHNRNEIFRRFIENSSEYDFPVPTAPLVEAFTPRRIVNNGVATIRISGQRLDGGMEVQFNGVPSPRVLAISERLIDVTLPLDRRVIGQVQIEVFNRSTGESASFDTQLEVLAAVPEPIELLPREGSEGDTIYIQGRDLLEGIEVYFGPTRSPQVSFTGFAGLPPGVVEVEAEAPPGSGTVPVRLVNVLPVRMPADVELSFTYEGTPFRRGDSNDDGTVDLTDAIRILGYSFLGDEVACDKALDVDDNGTIDVTDPIRLLSHLFLGELAPASPYEACGLDPTDDSLTCEKPSACR